MNNSIEKLNRNCECCMSAYASGKEYGNYWHQQPIKELKDGKWIIKKPSGLCEFCNFNNIWYAKNKSCHFKY